MNQISWFLSPEAGAQRSHLQQFQSHVHTIKESRPSRRALFIFVHTDMQGLGEIGNRRVLIDRELGDAEEKVDEPMEAPDNCGRLPICPSIQGDRSC